MSSSHRPLDFRSGLVLDTHDLGRRAGAMKLVRTTVEAPADLGTEVIGVPQPMAVVRGAEVRRLVVVPREESPEPLS